MQHADFVPLHLHTEYSLLDGAIRVPELVARASEFRMPAVAVTDHGNMFGAVEFYRAATKAGVKPVLGCEVYMAPGSRLEKPKAEGEEAAFHLVLLAKDNDGYKNLCSMISRSYLDGFYRKPRIDKALLEQYSGGLIGMSACLKGEVPYFLRRADVERAREAALFYKRVLGPENFFLELQENGLEEQEEINRRLYELGRELHIGLVATCDSHYLRREDARAHEILLCIQTGKTMSDSSRMRFEGNGFYFRAPEEMLEAFRHLPEAIKNTREIAERCNVEFRLGESKLPRFTPPDGRKPSQYLQELARKGLEARFGGEPPEAYRKRLAHELEVIRKMGYSSYFLIVWDFINHAKGKGIPVGPGRGSAAGSLVAYALGITEIDPIKYGLLFERFLNPERVSMPDIDVDFCKDRRGEVIQYVSDKYGKDRVAQIITFGTMAARACLRDVARVMDFPYAEADRLAKLVPETLKITLKEALEQERELKETYDRDKRVKELIDIAMKIEGHKRHASTHAAGVVISPEPLTDYAPLYKAPGEESITTQFDMDSVDKLGLIKFDFLGLKTLTIIQTTVDLLKESGVEFRLSDMPLDDHKTYEFLCFGATTGVFQLESEGMRDLLVKMQPDRFEDLIALVALYRPGPIKTGMTDDFIKRKKGQKAVHYELPQLREILEETYGVMVYQEQVMAIANRLAGFTMGQADVLRKAMGKKKPEVMAEQKEAFMRGAKANGIPEKKAEHTFDQMANFAEYGFNKSHSAAYAYITYQTAYLKAHYPVHFMAATLSADLDNTDKIVKSIRECRAMGIRILPPDINLCGSRFRVTEEGIRFGLGAVKGVGVSAIESIKAAREEGPFRSVEDFMRRVDTRRVNRKVVEALVKAGAFDSVCGVSLGRDVEELGRLRARAIAVVGGSTGQAPSLGLFGGPDEGADGRGAWDEMEILGYEKEALGFYISGNPLDKYRRELRALDIKGLFELDAAADRQEVETAGLVVSIKKLRTKKGEAMAAVGLEDGEGAVEVVVFPDLWQARGDIIKKDAPVYLRGTLEKTEKGNKVIAMDIAVLDNLLKRNREGRRAVISIKGPDADLAALRALLESRKGDMPLYLKVRSNGVEATILTSVGIEPDVTLIEQVEGLLGEGAFRVV